MLTINDQKLTNIVDFFSELPDPRSEINRLHKCHFSITPWTPVDVIAQEGERGGGTQSLQCEGKWV